MATTRTMTAADIERMGSAGERLELIDGIPRKKPPVSQRHGEIEAQLFAPLAWYVWAQGLGRVYPSDTQFTVQRDPDKILIPDVAFVRAERLAPAEERWHITPYPPDLAVEVVSPNDPFDEVMEKIELYRQAGVPLVWLVLPRRRAVLVYAQGQEPRTLGETDELDGGEVIPGFRLPVAELFR